ncbi:MAG: hypothetical protein ABIB65_01520, partial [Candidatus Margulisiibacteriota bacterium]
ELNGVISSIVQEKYSVVQKHLTNLKSYDPSYIERLANGDRYGMAKTPEHRFVAESLLDRGLKPGTPLWVFLAFIAGQERAAGNFFIRGGEGK